MHRSTNCHIGLKTKVSKTFNWVAVCQYPDKEGFAFYSPTFVTDDLNKVDEIAEEIVLEAWSKISPYPAPPIIDILPGYIGYVKE